MPRSYFVGFGANLASPRHGSPVETCRWALGRLIALCPLRAAAASPWYRSAPVPVSDQPDYFNAVAKLVGDLDPAGLLERMHQVEAEAGRTRAAPNAARALDLDLLAADDLVLPGPGLILPHPRLAERAFVLDPLCDVAPEWRHPVLGRTALELRDQLPPQRIQRLPPADPFQPLL